MRTQGLPGRYLAPILAEIKHDIDLLYVIPCMYTRNLVLNHIRDRIFMLEAMTDTAGPVQTAPVEQITQGNQSIFTPEQLSRFDGKNSNPAYIAVNGIVYDVTNTAAWAAATHFGLEAGRDVTDAFNSCHTGQPVLNNLKVVGSLTE